MQMAWKFIKGKYSGTRLDTYWVTNFSTRGSSVAMEYSNRIDIQSLNSKSTQILKYILLQELSSVLEKMKASA